MSKAADHQARQGVEAIIAGNSKMTQPMEWEAIEHELMGWPEAEIVAFVRNEALTVHQRFCAVAVYGIVTGWYVEQGIEDQTDIDDAVWHELAQDDAYKLEEITQFLKCH